MIDKVFCQYCQQWRDPNGSVQLTVRAKSGSKPKTTLKFQCYECRYRRVNNIPANEAMKGKR